MIEGIEKSPSDRAMCKWCGKKIGIGTPRGVESRQHGNHIEHYYCCHKCLPVKLNDDKNWVNFKTRELKKELKKMLKESKKAIILENLQ